MRTSPSLGRGVLDRVGEQVAQRLREPVGVGVAACPRGTGPSSKRRSASRLMPSHSSSHEAPQLDRLDAQELRLLGLGQQQQVVDQPADARDLGLHEALDAAHLLAGRARLRGEHFELAADHGQRRAQLVRGVGDERALAGERLGQAVEHVVEGVGEHAHLVALPAGVVDARVQVAGVDARGDRGHPAQRARHARADQVGAEQRADEREHAGEDERARDAVLGVRDGRQRLADADRHARCRPRTCTTRLSRRRSPTSGSASVE